MRYAQTEKELLAVVFAFTKFHQHVYSKDVIMESDHKPLEAILKKSLATAPPECYYNYKSTHLHCSTDRARR